MSERLMALGRYEELKLQAMKKQQLAEELRRLIREATAPIVDAGKIDATRVLLLAGELKMALDGTFEHDPGLRALHAAMEKIGKEYGI